MTKRMPTSAADEAILDAALDALHDRDPEFRAGLSNHGPMAAEALWALGHPERVPPFVDDYVKRLEPLARVEPVPLDRWQSARGRPELRAALIGTFDAWLARDPVDDVLARAVPLLAPGAIGAAFHGVLRAGHAVRAWRRAPTEARRVELAHGLGYWAARHQTIPGAPGRRAQPGRGPLATLRSVPLVPPTERVAGGLIFDRFGVLDGRADFAAAVESYDPHALAPDEALDEMVAACARLYLAASSERDRFVLLHGITSTAAVRLLLPLVGEPARVALVAHQLAALAAVRATHGAPGEPFDSLEPSAEVDPAALADRASSSRDDHTIKLVEACLREHRRSGRSVLLAVAAHRLALG